MSGFTQHSGIEREKNASLEKQRAIEAIRTRRRQAFFERTEPEVSLLRYDEDETPGEITPGEQTPGEPVHESKPRSIRSARRPVQSRTAVHIPSFELRGRDVNFFG
jgi:hypothetical protein